MQNTTCSLDQCEKNRFARGWCVAHYRRWQRKGGPSKPHRPTHGASRFLSKVERGESCWIWANSLSSMGYGRFTLNGKRWLAHRLAFTLHFGPIPDGLDIDHMCHNRACVNPAHLQAVTHKANLENQSGAHKGSTSSIRGVSWSKYHSKWVSQVTHDGKVRYLGRYASEQEAGRVAEAARNELFTNNLLDRIPV